MSAQPAVMMDLFASAPAVFTADGRETGEVVLPRPSPPLRFSPQARATVPPGAPAPVIGTKSAGSSASVLLICRRLT